MNRTSLILIGCLALGIRLANLLFFPIDFTHLVFHDAEMFWHGSEAMVRLGGYVTQGDVPQVERVPLYFLFLAALRLVFGASFLPILVAQCLIDTATCLMIACLGARFGARIGVISGVLAALWINLVVHTTYILSETLFLALFTLVLLSAARFIEHRSLMRAAILGLALGLATMTRSVTQFLIPVLPVVVLLATLYMDGAKSWRNGVAAALVALIAALAPLSPLLIRNKLTYGAWALASQGGNHLLFWVVPAVRSAADGGPRGQHVEDLQAVLEAKLAELPDAERLNPVFVDGYKTKMALKLLSEASPSALAKAWAEGAAQNLLSPALPLDPRIYLRPHPSLMETSESSSFGRIRAYIANADPVFSTALLVGLMGSAIFSALQLAGLAVLFRRNAWAATLAVMAIGYVLLISGPIGSAKYRIPVEPVFIILSALAIGSLALWRERAKPTE